MFFQRKTHAKKALIVGGSADASQVLNQFKADSFDLIIAADSGADICAKAKIVPHWIVGDLDSINLDALKKYREQSFVYQFPSCKDFTDLHLAADIAKDLGADDFTIVGWNDERFDYSLAVLYEFSEFQYPVQFIAKDFRVLILNKFKPEVQLMFSSQNLKCSVFTLKQPVTLKSQGLKWELNWNQDSASIYSLSNEILRPGNLQLSSGSAALFERF